MFRIVHLEMQKILPYRVFWAIFALFWLGTILGLVIAYFVNAVNYSGYEAPFKEFLYYPSVWGNFSWLISLCKNVFVIFLAIHVCNLFEYRMLRQHLIDGVKKREIIFGFLFHIFTLSLITAGSVLFLGVLLGLAPEYYDYGLYFNWVSSTYIAGLFVNALFSFTFVVLLAVIFQKSGPTIFFWIFYVIIGEKMLGWVAHFFVEENLNNYLPLKASEALIPFPPFFASPTAKLPELPLFSWVTTGIYTLLFLSLSSIKLYRSDH